MGRSTVSCFKIMTCGGDAVGNDGFRASQSKGFSNKTGWSFRKRSSRDQALTDTVISETPSHGNKEISESAAAANFQPEANSTIPEKTSVMQWTDEKPHVPISVNSNAQETVVSADDTKVDFNLHDTVIIVIQTAIRGLLAQRALLKLRHIVKLQAVIRGHLVRICAVGTLRCVKAIVKMQTLVRSRRACILVGAFPNKGKLDSIHVKDNCSLTILEKEKNILNPSHTSIEKLLSNKFACQLLESTPGNKPVRVKCDPSKSDSAWKWLERWTAVSSIGVDQVEQQSVNPEFIDKQEHGKIEPSSIQVEAEIPSESCCDSKNNTVDTAASSETEESLFTYNADNFDFQVSRPASSSSSDNLEQPQPENTGTSNSNENSLNLLPNQTTQSDLISLMEPNSHSTKPELESELVKLSAKRFAPEQLEIEGKKFVFGSRKASNPAFIAAQSKFEDLSSTANSRRSFSSSNQDIGIESNMAIRMREIGMAEASALHVSKVQVGGSECGTELSISSTLDSPDRSEVGAMEFEQGANISEERTGDVKNTKNLDVEANGQSIQGYDASYSITAQPDKLHDINGADGQALDSIMAIDSLQVTKKAGENVYEMQTELEPKTGHQASRSSPDASPRSRSTVPESQETPSSLVTVKAKRTKSDHKGGSNPKRRSMSGFKRSTANSGHDSCARISLEQSPKDHKTEKHRNSLASAKLDRVDQEPRDSISSNSLPNYMQATESAKAKALANSSPRSSPDLQVQDTYIKKRHSLPGANGKQGSHTRRSVSQAQQGAKGTDRNHPHERRWQK